MRMLPLPVLMLLSGCTGVQSMVGGGGFHSEQFGGLFSLFLWVSGIFYLLVIGFLIAAAVRKRGKAQDGHEDKGESNERGLGTTLAAWAGLIVLGLAVLTLASYVADADSAAARPGKAVKVEIVANQWWWDIRYQDPTQSDQVRTANELHLPAGVPVHIRLKSNDVIHSFWVPRLAGKQDLIPGRINDILLIAKRPGLYRGQCAEFCGVQHAHMALDVVVESPAQFERWLLAGLAPGKPPANPLQRAGYDYFMTRECSTCHRIAGTPANGQVAPDLTHLASRRSIAAGTFPMTRGHLYAWVADPQGAKPGNNMPYIGLESQELHSVVAYLEALK